MSEQDKDLFAQAMQDVMPLKNDNKISQYDREKQRQISHLKLCQLKRKQPSHRKSLNLDPSQVFTKVGAFERMEYAQKGVQLREMNRLKKGEFTVQSLLDLHGFTHQQAEGELNAFLADAIGHKLRFIRIVHGKGYNSESEFPVLKNLTNEILRQCPQVIAFTSAAERDGGVGAVNVMLKA